MAISHQDKTSAADTSVGFDYQFYYFFYLILGLKLGESIGFEVKDDIHIDFADGTSELIQTKHTVQTTTGGEPINLTELSGDLWKTLSNWAMVIKEQSDGKVYLSKTKFRLITNKANRSNTFIQNLRKFQSGDMTITEIKSYIADLPKKTSDTDLQTKIKEVLSLKATLKDFLGRISIDLEEDDMITRIKNRIQEKIYIKQKVDDVYNTLHSSLRDKNYLQVKAGDKMISSFEDFAKQFQNCFKEGFSTRLPKRDLPVILPDKADAQLFIRQLIDIGDIIPSDQDRIIELTTHMLMFINNYRFWETNDGLLPSQKQEFEKNSQLIWKNAFQKVYRTIKQKLAGGVSITELEEEIKTAALACLDELKKEMLILDETPLDTELCNGHFYFLTEEKTIGWHYSWETLY